MRSRVQAGAWLKKGACLALAMGILASCAKDTGWPAPPRDPLVFEDLGKRLPSLAAPDKLGLRITGDTFDKIVCATSSAGTGKPIMDWEGARRTATSYLQNFSAAEARPEIQSLLAATVGSYAHAAGPAASRMMQFPVGLPLTKSMTAPGWGVAPYHQQLEGFIAKMAENADTRVINYLVLRVVRGRTMSMQDVMARNAAECAGAEYLKGLVPGAILAVGVRIEFRDDWRNTFRDGDGDKEKGFGKNAPFQLLDPKRDGDMKNFLRKYATKIDVHVRHLGPETEAIMGILRETRCNPAEWDSCLDTMRKIQDRFNQSVKELPQGFYQIGRGNGWPILQYEVGSLLGLPIAPVPVGPAAPAVMPIAPASDEDL